MAKSKITVEWSVAAFLHFDEILEHLFKESEVAATIVGNTILNEVKQLPQYFNAHPLDRFKRNNDGHYRAFMVYSYRISYYVNESTIYVLRIRHTSREPLDH